MRRAIALGVACGCLLAPAASAGVLSGNCRVQNQPAATLLVPFFEVDLDDPSGVSTLFSVNNARSGSTLARVVLWTDWGLPTLAFDLYLTGYDVQTLNVRDLFQGHLPRTGATVSPHGTLSKLPESFAGCSGSTTGDGMLPPADLAWLAAAHGGRALPGSSPPQCLASPQADPSYASGYITVDVVRRCSPVQVGSLRNTPADPLYFVNGGQGLAGNDNALWGDFFYVRPGNNSAAGNAAVHLVADADLLTSGIYTFYGRYVGFDGRDNRIPLSSLYYTRFVDGGTFDGGTRLVVWRDTRDGQPRPLPCGTNPLWLPLGVHQLVAFDEDENPVMLNGAGALPLATQAVSLGGTELPVPQDFGWLLLDLWHADETHAQAWVGAILTAEGRFSASQPGIAVDDLCNFGP
jgi:hypothetical protein